MSSETSSLLGIALISLGFVLFFLMVFCIIMWGPAALAMMAVSMGLFVAGGLMISRPGAPAVSETEGAIGAGMLPDGPKEKVGFGNGYCPSCGSPLNEGDSFCGACGKKL